jgi:hypothetical protein
MYRYLYNSGVTNANEKCKEGGSTYFDRNRPEMNLRRTLFFRVLSLRIFMFMLQVTGTRYYIINIPGFVLLYSTQYGYRYLSLFFFFYCTMEL